MVQSSQLILTQEGMKKLMPVYHVIGGIPAVRNMSNKIVVMERK